MDGFATSLLGQRVEYISILASIGEGSQGGRGSSEALRKDGRTRVAISGIQGSQLEDGGTRAAKAL